MLLSFPEYSICGMARPEDHLSVGFLSDVRLLRVPYVFALKACRLLGSRRRR